MTAQDSNPPDDGYPVAYCAPGQRAAAVLTLMLNGEQVKRIVEHPWLGDSADVIIVGENPWALQPGDFMPNWWRK